MYNQGYQPGNGAPEYPPYSQYPQNGSAWYAPMPGNTSPAAAKGKAARKGGGSGNGRRPRKRKSFKWQLIKFLLILVLLVGAAAGIYITKVQSDIRPYRSVFLDNISIDGINLSGMTWEEGSSAVWAQAREKQGSWKVRLKNSAGSYKDITAETLGISFDPSAALEEAWTIGHDVNPLRRKTIFELRDEINQMKGSSAEFYSMQQSANTAPIDEILDTLERMAYIEPQDAVLLDFNPDDAVNPFVFQDERMGQRLDTTAVKEEILEMVQTFQSGEILLEPELIPPAVTKADLKKTVSLRYRAVTPIDKSSTENRTENIRIAFRKINGLKITDGSRFSFNKVVGKRTEKNGFLTALEYAYGELVDGWGGGVCQASTTVYLAAIQSGLTITERHQHSNVVSYTKQGQDATVSDTKGRELDFGFKNTSGGTIYISAHVVQDSSNKNRLLCEVRIYGLSLENTKYELESEMVQNLPIPAETEIIEDKNATYVTYVDEQKVIEGMEGSIWDTYLCTIVDGVQVDRKKLYTDTYKNRKQRIYVGVTPRW